MRPFPFCNPEYLGFKCERLNVRFLMMAIKIQQYNGNNYSYLPPTYASSSTQAENSDKLDGYHATDFLKENQLGSI